MGDTLTVASLCRGAYLLGAPLGKGGTASVYRARRSTDAEEVAAKVIPVTEIEEPAQLLSRYRAVARLSHPNLLPIYDVGISEQVFFVITPLAGEGSLRQLLHYGQLSANVAVRLISQVADALQYLHDRGIVHLDVKPANIMLAAGRRPLLGDFGLLQLEPGPTGRPRIRGTPAYMSPEQCRLEPSGPASDQYALAVTSFELLTGRRPFVGSTPAEMLLRQSAEPPPSPRALCPSLSYEVERVVLKALAKYPGQRFPTVAAFAHALERAVLGAALGARPPLRAAADEATLDAVTLELGA
jgi:serine/threonine protein kinase